MAIVIGGSPGTGKTEVACILGEMLSFEVISLGDIARDFGCISETDFLRDTEIIDEDCLVDAILQILESKNERIIIEGHYIDLVPNSEVDVAIILRTHPETLRERLQQRGYSENKVAENVEAETIGVCQLDALDAFTESKVMEIDTTNLSAKETAKRILAILKGKRVQTRIDWMELLEKEGRLDDFLTK